MSAQHVSAYLRCATAVCSRKCAAAQQDQYSSGEKPYLGLEHADTGPRRPQQNRYGGYERAIKIA